MFNSMLMLLLTKFILNDVPHTLGLLTNPQHDPYTPFWHPRFRQVGPTEATPPEVWEIWNKALEAAKQKYPIDDPVLIAEAKRAELSQEKMQMLIAQDEYLQEKNKLSEKWREEHRGEECEVEEGEKEEE